MSPPLSPNATLPEHGSPGSDLPSPPAREEADVSARAGHLPLPAGARTGAIVWPYVVGIGVVHVLSLLVFVPWLFSWAGVVAWFLGLYVFGVLGINLCYHRLLTHRGFKTPKWLERTFATLGVCCLEDTPARWVAVHRLHHLYSDEQADPHSPRVTFLWGHMNWLFRTNRDTIGLAVYEKYAKDILRDPYYRWLERKYLWVWVNSVQWAAFFLAGLAAGWLVYRAWLPAVQLGASLWLWGAVFRTVAVWHITWSVNSLCHVFGYQNYATGDYSTNNWFVSIIASGEGWHNNHHADQVAAAHGHTRWELDLTYWLIRGMALCGLAWDIIPPRCWKSPQK